MHEEDKIKFLNVLQKERHNLTDVEIITGIKRYQLHKDNKVSIQLRAQWKKILDDYNARKRRTLRRRRKRRKNKRKPHLRTQKKRKKRRKKHRKK